MKKLWIIIFLISFFATAAFAAKYIGDLTEDVAPAAGDFMETENAAGTNSYKVQLGNLGIAIGVDTDGDGDADNLDATAVTDIADGVYQPYDATNLTALAAQALISGVTPLALTSNADANPYIIVPTTGYLICTVDLTVHTDDYAMTISETGAINDQIVIIHHISGDTATWTDDSGVMEIQGYAETEVNDVLIFKYCTDRWVLIGKSVATEFFANLNMNSGTLTIPTTTSGDQTLTVGKIGLKTDEDYIVTHGGANGQVTTEVAVPLFIDKAWSFDPDAVCDLTTDRLFLMTVDHSHGITILEWKLSFDVDPGTEFGANHVMLKRADAFIGVANAADMDALDTTNGAASESTIANINAGAVIADGKVIYLQFDTAYTEALHQCIFEMRYKIEED